MSLLLKHIEPGFLYGCERCHRNHQTAEELFTYDEVFDHNDEYLSGQMDSSCQCPRCGASIDYKFTEDGEMV